MTDAHTQQDERLRRWRLMLGKAPDGTGVQLTGDDQQMDAALAALYGERPEIGGRGAVYSGGLGADGDTDSGETSADRQGGLGDSNPGIARWLGDIRRYFPNDVVRVMQHDAMNRLDMKALLMEPELLQLIEPDVHLIADIIALSQVMPNKTKASAREVVRQVVQDLQKRLRNPMQQAIAGSLNRAERNLRPRFNEINWHGTIRRNLKHYQPNLNTIIPEALIGYGRRRASLRDIILLVDESGSMAASVVYSSIFGAVLASLPAVNTHMIVFDTNVVDLTAELDDPVELLFGTQLGGGTDINRALGFAERLITRPHDTIVVLISDLYEGGNRDEMLQRVRSITEGGAQMVALLALSDDGTPSYDSNIAARMKALDVSAFACTPGLFPSLMAAAINRDDLGLWAAHNDIVTAG